MKHITFAGGPRDGERDIGEWAQGQQILTIGTGDVPDAIDAGIVIELAWHVYRAVLEGDHWRAEHKGLFAAHELPSV